MKQQLLNYQKIQGIYIDRRKNLDEDSYDVDWEQSDAQKVVFKRIVTQKEKTLKQLIKSKRDQTIRVDEGNVSFEQLMKNRKPSGTEDDFEVIQVSIQIESNLRIGFEHTKEPELYCGAKRNYNDFEKHSITFEKYAHMPIELRVKKDKMMEEAMKSKAKYEELKHEEVFNPWLITDVDFSVGSPFLVNSKDESEDP